MELTRERAVELGLLPNPDQAGRVEYGMHLTRRHALLEYYEDLIRRAGEDLEAARQTVEAQQVEIGRLDGQNMRMAALLRFAESNRDIDVDLELSLEMFRYATAGVR